LELRDGTSGEAITAPHLESFGLTLDGVPLQDRLTWHANASSVDRELRLSFPFPVVYNGWFFTTSRRGSLAKDPVRFEMLVSGMSWVGRDAVAQQHAAYDAYEESGWRDESGAAPEVWRHGASGRYPCFSELVDHDVTLFWPTPVQRGMRTILDHSWMDGVYVVSSVLLLIMGLLLMVIAAAGALRREPYGKWILGLFFMVSGVRSFLDLLQPLCRGWNEVLNDCGFFVGSIVCSYVCSFREDLLLRAMLISSINMFLLAFLEFLVDWFAGYWWIEVVVVWSIVLALVTGFAVLGIYLRKKHVRSAWELVRPDKERYDRVWEEIVSKPGNKESLGALKKEVSRGTVGCEPSLVRQLNRKRSSRGKHSREGLIDRVSTSLAKHSSVFGWSGPGGGRVTDGGTDDVIAQMVVDNANHVLGPDHLQYVTFPGTVDPFIPVVSMDQLYFQASGMSPMLRSYVIKWASQSNGKMRFRRPAGAANGGNACAPGQCEGQGRWITTWESWEGAVGSVGTSLLSHEDPGGGGGWCGRKSRVQRGLQRRW